MAGGKDPHPHKHHRLRPDHLTPVRYWTAAKRLAGTSVATSGGSANRWCQHWESWERTTNPPKAPEAVFGRVCGSL